MVFDAIVTGLMIWYMRPHFKNGSASTIMRVFLREGLLYFVVMCVLRAQLRRPISTLANALNIAFFAQTVRAIAVRDGNRAAVAVSTSLPRSRSLCRPSPARRSTPASRSP